MLTRRPPRPHRGIIVATALPCKPQARRHLAALQACVREGPLSAWHQGLKLETLLLTRLNRWVRCEFPHTDFRAAGLRA